MDLLTVRSQSIEEASPGDFRTRDSFVRSHQILSPSQIEKRLSFCLKCHTLSAMRATNTLFPCFDAGVEENISGHLTVYLSMCVWN